MIRLGNDLPLSHIGSISMTFQTPVVLQDPPSGERRPQVCALIEQYFGSTQPSSPLIVENVERLRRQLDALDIDEIVGLGDMPPGASLLLLRGDILFELATIDAMASSPGRGAQIDDMLAAVHVEAGDAAAALSKFRREETSGWEPFQIAFARLGKFKSAGETSGLLALFMRRRVLPIAKAAILPTSEDDKAHDPMENVWAKSPGLDPLVRPRKIYTVQKEAFDAFGLTPNAWQGIGFLLLLVLIGFGVLGWGIAGAVVALFAVGCFDLAERAADLKDLRLSKSTGGLCVQSLVIACLWLFVVFAAKQGSVAQMPALVLLVLPLAFIIAQATSAKRSFSREAAFGVYFHAILASVSVVMIAVPLVSVFCSAIALASLLAAIASGVVTLAAHMFPHRAAPADGLAASG